MNLKIILETINFVTLEFPWIYKLQMAANACLTEQTCLFLVFA